MSGMMNAGAAWRHLRSDRSALDRRVGRATVRRVLDGLGIDCAGVEIPPSRLKVLRNAETEEWVERYERDAAAR